ncbi:MAG: hypothetical protein PHH00_04240 [Candidatus Nanoarchaeia archaeon]|nr:hypothetical protein [Candidatus Nanoarchaeia archaeon]
MGTLEDDLRNNSNQVNGFEEDTSCPEGVTLQVAADFQSLPSDNDYLFVPACLVRGSSAARYLGEAHLAGRYVVYIRKGKGKHQPAQG